MKEEQTKQELDEQPEVPTKEHQIVKTTALPITVKQMVQELQALGIQEGDILLVHSSLSSLGWVCGGPQAVVEALFSAVGTSGTLVMPAQSGDWSDPAEWGNPAVPEPWVNIIYQEMPAFDPAVTPTRGMGRIAEMFRVYPGSLRSNHPQVSFTANGSQADFIVSEHALTPQFGDGSPLGKLYGLNAKVLLLGAGFGSCTSFHLAETRLKDMPVKKMGAAIRENGERLWKWFEDFAYDSEDFADIGEAYKPLGKIRSGQIGNAACFLFPLREGVDFAAQWLERNRLA